MGRAALRALRGRESRAGASATTKRSGSSPTPRSATSIPEFYNRIFGQDYEPDEYIHAALQARARPQVVHGGAAHHHERRVRLRPGRQRSRSSRSSTSSAATSRRPRKASATTAARPPTCGGRSRIRTDRSDSARAPLGVQLHDFVKGHPLGGTGIRFTQHATSWGAVSTPLETLTSTHAMLAIPSAEPDHDAGVDDPPPRLRARGASSSTRAVMPASSQDPAHDPQRTSASRRNSPMQNAVGRGRPAGRVGRSDDDTSPARPPVART